MTIYTDEHSKHRKFTTRLPTLYTKSNELVEYTDSDVAFFVRYKNQYHCFRSRPGFPDKDALNAPYQTHDDWVQKNPGRGSQASSSSASSAVFATPPPEPRPKSPVVQRLAQPSTPQIRSRTRITAPVNLEERSSNASLPKINTARFSDLPLRNLAPEFTPSGPLPTYSPESPFQQRSSWKIKSAPRRGRSGTETPTPFAARKSLKRTASIALESDEEQETPSFASPITRSRVNGLKNFKFSMF